MRLALITVAGAAGAATRYGIGLAAGVRTFPWATLAINLTGSFLLGVIVKAALDRDWSPTVTLPITVGFLGAYTTFSTFSVEVHSMLRTDRVGEAAAYVGSSLIGGVLAAALGYALAAALT